MFIYHIVLPEVWEDSKGRPSYQAESLQTEGFIHCSFESQLDGVISRYYRGVDGIVVLKLDTEKLRSKLVKEVSTNGEIYPHLYGRLNLDAVVAVEERRLAPE
jgi:uncharacterized protein (DUF952 family)